MKSIYTLTTDIQYLLTQRDWVTDDIAANLGQEVSRRLQEQFATRREGRALRLSRMGPQCPCALWYSVHHPELAEPLPPWAEFKYSFGHIIEAQAIMLAKAAGHTVTGEQDEVVVDDIVGHRDCVIDGCIVDVKSTSSRGFQDFKAGNHHKLDTWGYLSQLDGYLVGSLSDPLVTVKDRAFLLAIDKQLGHMVLYEHFLRESQIRARISEYKRIVRRQSPPACSCETQPDGKSGNIKLGTRASYSPYKYCCFPRLRTFLYSDGPRYLTHVVREPKDVTEVDKYGKKVYN